jgi:murein DD-endopeptidase MepM/ murein hydrolase activator NlpD
MKPNKLPPFACGVLILITLVITACQPGYTSAAVEIQPAAVTPTATLVPPTPLATRPVYEPGTLVDYAAQPGDTLPALAAHFNTTEAEIRQANPVLPAVVTTLPPGMPMKIPIYYVALWGNSFQILPDALFVDGPAQTGFDTVAFVNSKPGWLKNYTTFAGEKNRTGGEVVDYVAITYSVSPRLLLALAEYQAGALSNPIQPEDQINYPLGYADKDHVGLYMQLVWAANTLNNGYYRWREGTLNTITRLDGSIEHPDPWQNAATVALQAYFSQLLPVDQYQKAIYSDGLAKTYIDLFGDPWNVKPNIEGSLTQPELTFPFPAGKTWAFTGGPHAAWGTGDPLAAIDFAPPSNVGGCATSTEFATAVAPGEIVRTDNAVAVLDLDGDGNERTGWVILYLHLASQDKINQGVMVKTGDPIGHPSCEGGKATGTHVHIARKYNGEWIPADGALPFDLNGWIASNGAAEYQGTLTRFGKSVIASESSSSASLVSNTK